MSIGLESKEDRMRLARAMGIISGASHADEYEKIIELLERHIIPEFYPKTEAIPLSERELGMESYAYRNAILQNCGYALLAYEWIRPLSQWIGGRRCLEIMAGSGAFTHALSQCGVDVIATDDKSWSDPRSKWFASPWTEVEQLDCLQAISKYGADRQIIICSWPYMDDSAYHALLEMRKVNPGAVLLYIGEWECGATASQNFFDAALPVNDPEFDQAVVNFKQTWGMHDLPILIK